RPADPRRELESPAPPLAPELGGQAVPLPTPSTLEEVVRGVSPLRIALRSFRAHRPAMFGLGVLAGLYLVAIFADFIAPYGADNQVRDLQWTPPSTLHFRDDKGFSWRPFIYPIRGYVDEQTFEVKQAEEKSQRAYMRFFVQGDPYKLLGLI